MNPSIETNTVMNAPIQPVDPSPAPPSQTSPRRGPWHERRGGLHVLKLVGTPREMGRQHGRMLRDEVRRGPIPYYRTYLETLMGRSGIGALSPLLWPLLQKTIGRRVAEGFPEYALESVRGLAEGAEMPLDALMEGCSLPDALMWVAARLMGVRRIGPAVAHRLALGLGCTSAIAWGDATVDGKLLHARNLDYHGVGVWPDTAGVFFHEPDEGLRYVSVAAAGVVMGGVTAMNEAGLTLTVHQHMFTDQTRLGGMPIGCVGDQVMREARNLDDAERILRAQTPIGCWTYLVADGNTREVLCFEESPNRKATVKRDGEGDRFAYANIYLDEALGATEKALYGSYWRHNLGRHRQAWRRLNEGNEGGFDAAAMAGILADPGETPECRIATAISMVMTVASVVFRPEDGRLWVADGSTPTSQRDFLCFDLRGAQHLPDETVVPAGREDEARAEAYAAYRRAYLAYVDDSNVEAARTEMKAACEGAPEQPLFHALRGLIALQAGDADAAFGAMSRALELGHPHPERVASFHLWRARAADRLGRRDDARRDYRQALGRPADAPVHRAATRGLRQPFLRRDAERFQIDLTFADVVNP